MAKLSGLFFAALSAEAALAVDVWPKDTHGNKLPCPSVTVLHDTAAGWPGSCLGLKESDNTTEWNVDACASLCKANAQCNTWQVTDEKKCWLGVPGYEGYQCFGRDGDTSFKAVGAQRLQQGTIKVLKSYSVEWVSGLKNVGVMETASGVVDKERCKSQCYSDVDCRYWMYGEGGCWLEQAPDFVVPDVPVVSTTSDQAKTMVGGENIVHQCLPPPPPEESNLPLLLGVIGGALLAACCLGLIFHMFCMAPKKVKRTRAVKVAPKKEAPPLTYTLLEPTYTTYVTSTPTYQMVPQAPMMAAPPMVASSVAIPAMGSVQMAPMAAGSVQMAPAMVMESPMQVR